MAGNIYRRLVLVRGIPSSVDAADVVRAVFLPFDDAPVVLGRLDNADIVLLGHPDNVNEALSDPTGWFHSLGLQLSPVGESMGIGIFEQSTFPGLHGLTGPIEETFELDELRNDLHRCLLLVRGLPSDVEATDIVKAIFLPFDEAPVVLNRFPNADVVLLGHPVNVTEALRDLNGWFDSLGLQLSPVLCESMMLYGFTGTVEDKFEWDELWNEKIEAEETTGANEGSHSTSLEVAVINANSAQEVGNNFENDMIEGVQRMKQNFLALPSELQHQVMMDFSAMMTDHRFPLDCLNQQGRYSNINQTEPPHIRVDMPSTSHHVSGNTNNPNGQREGQTAAQSKWWLWKSLVSSVIASAVSHAVLYVLSRKLETGEKKITGNPDKPDITKKDYIGWFLEKIFAPVCLCVVMCLMRVYVIGAEEKVIHPEFTHNAVANLAINSVSKIAYFAIKEFPSLIASLYLWAHVASFLIDLLGAIFLWWHKGYPDPDVPDT